MLNGRRRRGAQVVLVCRLKERGRALFHAMTPGNKHLGDSKEKKLNITNWRTTRWEGAGYHYDSYSCRSSQKAAKDNKGCMSLTVISDPDCKAGTIYIPKLLKFWWYHGEAKTLRFMGGKRRMHLGERPPPPPTQRMQISFRYLKNRKRGKGEPATARQNCVKYVNVKKSWSSPPKRWLPRDNDEKVASAF